MSDDELLSAYADGIAELAPDERRRVDELLAREAGARAELEATRALIGKLRSLPRDADAPDLAAAISRAVGPTVPRPWWRSWRWLVPIGALAATAAAALVLIAREPRHEAPVARATQDASVPQPAPQLKIDDTQAADSIWLAGQIVELSDPTEIDAELDALDRELDAEPENVSAGLLPASDLAWIDDLDDAAIDRVALWLEKKKT